MNRLGGGSADTCSIDVDGTWMSVLVSGYSSYLGGSLEVTNALAVYSPRGNELENATYGKLSYFI